MRKTRTGSAFNKAIVCLFVIAAMFAGTYLSDVRIAFAVSNEATLTTLQYDGKNIAAFTADSFTGTAQTDVKDDTVTYTVELSSGTSQVPTVTATASDGSTLGTVTPATSLPGVTTVEVTQGSVKHYYKVSFTVASIPSDAYYVNSGDKVENWQAMNNANDALTTALVRSVGGEIEMAVTPTGNVCVYDKDALSYGTQTAGFTANDALYHAKLRFSTNPNATRVGLMVRGLDGRNHGTVAFDAGKISWHAHINGGAKNLNGIGTFEFKPNVTYDIKVQIIGTNLMVLIDDVKVVEKAFEANEIPAAPTYYFGYRVWNSAQTFFMDDMYVAPIDEELGKAPEATDKNEFAAPAAGKSVDIASDTLKVAVGKDFPYIYSYKNAQDDKFLANGIDPTLESTPKMNVNGRILSATSVMTASDASSRTYAITVQAAASGTNEAVDCVITAKLLVTDNKMRLEFPSIVEKNSTIVRYFAIPEHDTVTVAGAKSGAAFSQITGWGPMTDKFVDLNLTPATATTALTSYALAYDRKAGSAIAFESNAMDGQRRYTAQERVSADLVNEKADKSVSITASAWYWHYLNKDVAMIPGYVPYVEVIVGGDANNDGTITWQDAGVLYREIRKEAQGSEDVKNYWNYIAMNMSNAVGNPSLRILDRAKAIAYQTDGFGQKVMNKGYQVSGHDDSHGDYDNVSEQQGGIADFETLNTVGKNFNVKTGIHINMTEFALDGFETVLENLRGYNTTGLGKNWNWLDQAYLVDKNKDISSGELERRLGELKTALPNLDWVYVDVYQSGSAYEAKMAAYYLNKNGFTLATEAAGDFEGDTTFFHWNTDLYYPIGGTQSSVMRFLQNDIADKFAPDRALLGMTMPGVSDWRNETRFDDAREVFYRNNLPSKYLQHFDLMSWVPGESATFSDGVTATVVEETVDGKTKYFNEIKKDGKLFARVDVTSIPKTAAVEQNAPRTTASKVFMPWSPESEEKIYYYNDYATSSTWDLPASWSGVTKAQLYKLTDNGREFVGEVTPSANKITIEGAIGQAYILDKVKNATGGLGASRLPAADGKWGEGSPIKNFGFSGKTLEGWTNSGVSIDSSLMYVSPNTGKMHNSFDPRAKFAEAGGRLSQQITVEAGKSYSVSVYVSTQNRAATLEVEADGIKQINSVKSTDIEVLTKPSKYFKQKYERLKVNFTAKSNTAKVALTIVAGSGEAYADDFRIWEWQNVPAATAEMDQYDLIAEDFENLDQEFGPFVSQVGSQPYIHMTQKDLTASNKQIKNYVIGGEWSIKDQQTSPGVHMRTLPSTLKFKSGNTYRLTMDYQTYSEFRTSGESKYDAQSGFNMPIEKAAYSLELRSGDGTVAKQIFMDPSSFASTNYTYNSQPSTEKMDVLLQDVTDDMYLTISKLIDGVNEILVIDNIRLREVMTRPEDKQVKYNQAHGLPAQIDVIQADGTKTPADVTYSGYSATTVGEQNVTGTVNVATLGLGVDSITFTVKVTVQNKLISYTKPADKAVIKGEEHGLPGKITVTMVDGSTQDFDVTYTGNYDKTKTGEYALTGTIDTKGMELGENFQTTFTVKVTVNTKKGCSSEATAAGAVAGGIALTALIGASVLLLKRKRKEVQ